MLETSKEAKGQALVPTLPEWKGTSEVWSHRVVQGGWGETVREASYRSRTPGKGLVLGGCVSGNQQATGTRVTLRARLPGALSSS